MDNGWQSSAQAWINDQGELGDFGRRFVLDPVMLPRALSRSPKTALDIGCGEGRFCRMLRAHGIAATGLDPTPALLASAQTRDPQGTYLEASAERLPLPSHLFDLVVSYLSLIDIPDIAAAIPEMARVLKPGGTLLIANLNSFNSACGDNGWVRDWKGQPQHYRMDNYMDERSMWLDYRGIRIQNYHRPFRTYMQALLATGLQLTHFDEPQPTPEAPPVRAAKYRRAPHFLVMEWIKPFQKQIS